MEFYNISQYYSMLLKLKLLAAPSMEFKTHTAKCRFRIKSQASNFEITTVDYNFEGSIKGSCRFLGHIHIIIQKLGITLGPLSGGQH